MTFTSCQTGRQIRNLAQTSPYCPARKLMSACHCPIKTRGEVWRVLTVRFLGSCPSCCHWLPKSLLQVRLAIHSTSQASDSLGSGIAVLPFDDKNQFTLHNTGRKRKRASCGVPSLLHTFFFFFFFNLRLCSACECDCVALAVFDRSVKSCHVRFCFFSALKESLTLLLDGLSSLLALNASVVEDVWQRVFRTLLEKWFVVPASGCFIALSC